MNKDIFREMTASLSASRIHECAARNGERLFGYIIDYIKDMYGLSKPEAWDTATEICKHFNLHHD